MLRFCILVIFGFSASILFAAESSRPNVLLICVDDLKPTLGCYGDVVAQTPHIDTLAARGLRFDAAYCNQAVCSPSRNSLLTSLRPETIGIYDLPTHFRFAAPDAITLPQHFIKFGYQAQGLGKILHVGHGNIDDLQSWSVPSWHPKAAGYLNQENVAAILPDSQGKKRGPATEIGVGGDLDYADGQIATEAIERLTAASASKDQPFFIAAGFMKPHLPFVAPKKYWDQYDPAKLPLPPTKKAPEGAPSYAPTNGGELKNYSDMGENFPPDETTTRHLIHGYYAATSYMDSQVGRVLDSLQQLGLADNTIVVLWGDHGWHLGDHGMWCKHTNYEQAARIPLIVAAPDGRRGESTTAMVETVDIYPTLAELAGIEKPAHLDGRSFAPVVSGTEPTARTHVTHVYPRGNRLGRAIRDARYRMVQWKAHGQADETAEFELYDYQNDPTETVNIAAKQPEIVAKLRKLLAAHGEAKPQFKKGKPDKAKTATKISPARNKKVDRNLAFDKRDQDKDGFLTFDEFMLNQPDPEVAPTRFPVFDRNSDGKLSVDEYVNPK
jgi:iduronate 2-sulfatase